MDYYLDLTDDRLKVVKDMLISSSIVALDFWGEKHIKCGDVVVFSPAYKLDNNVANMLPKGCIVFAGKQSDEIMSSLSHCVYLNIMDDEEFVVDNAILTAENFLPLLIEHTKSSIYDEDILILGGGRVAKSLWALFHKMGVKFTACMRNEEQLCLSKIFTHSAFNLSELKKRAKDYSVIINTIPSKLFDKTDKFRSESVIFELSSTPCIEEGVVTFIPCSALPGKYAPKTAGKILYESIKRRLKNLNKK